MCLRKPLRGQNMVSQFPASKCLRRHNLQPKNQSVSGDILAAFTLDNMHFYLQYVSRHLQSVSRDKLPIFITYIYAYNMSGDIQYDSGKKFQLQNVSGDTISSYKMSPETQFPATKCLETKCLRRSFILDNMPFTYNMSPETYK